MRRKRRSRGQRRGWRWLGLLVAACCAALGILHVLNTPQNLPWTPLDLAEQPGWFTGRKLAALDGKFATCRALLTRAGVRYTIVPPLSVGACGYADGIELGGGSRAIAFDPAHPKMACSVGAALSMWEWTSVQPAALRRFGSRVVRFEQLGTYNCRAIAGSASPSQHSYARAIDISGFVLADGRRISVAEDWAGTGNEARFLRDVRDGACALFSTTLSPDYNASHHDHLHLDEAPRGETGWRACR